MAGRSTKILDRFPAFFRTENRDKVLDVVVDALGQGLDQAEQAANAIQRSHRIAVAAEERDVLQLAALAGLERADFFILRTFYENRFFAVAEQDVAVTFSGGKTSFDFLLKVELTGGTPDSVKAEITANLQPLLTPGRKSVALGEVRNQLGSSALYRFLGGSVTAIRTGDNADLTAVSVTVQAPADPRDLEARAYAAYVARLRNAILRTIGILTDGCGTLHALLEGTSILLNADTTGPMEHPDAGQPRGGFIHRIPVTYQVVDSGKPVPHSGFVFIVENPLEDKSTGNLPRSNREAFRVTRKGFFSEPVGVQVTGMGNRTVLPLVINETTHEGLGFEKPIKDGQVLLFSTGGNVLLDGEDVTGSAYYFKGALHDFSKFDSSDKADAFPVSTPPGALDLNIPRPALTPATHLPVLQLDLGDTDWRFSVRDALFDAATLDESVFESSSLGIISAPATPPSPSGKVQLLWKEETPFAVTILLPVDVKSLETSVLGGQDLRKLVRAGLERYRSAGIQLNVDYFADHWVLGESILRAENATSGPGVFFDSTVLSA